MVTTMTAWNTQSTGRSVVEAVCSFMVCRARGRSAYSDSAKVDGSESACAIAKAVIFNADGYNSLTETVTGIT
jgi:hypothetical protein